MFSIYRFDSRGSVPGILARDSTDDILAQNASIATIACAPAVGFADGWLDNGAKMARLAFCALGGRAAGVAQAGSGETRTGYVRGPGVDGGCAVHDVGRAPAWNADASVAFDVSRIKCTHLRYGGGQAGCIVLQSGRGQSRSSR